MPAVNPPMRLNPDGTVSWTTHDAANHGGDEIKARPALSMTLLLAAALGAAGCSTSARNGPRHAGGDAGLLIETHGPLTQPAAGRASGHPARASDRAIPADPDEALVSTAELESGRVIEQSTWVFRGVKGRLFTSPNYLLYTTGSKPWMHAYAVRFAEDALEHYRTSLADLPAPTRPLEIYLFAQRSEWQEHTRDLMGEHADLYLNLGRGGYATRGRAVLYDIDFNDTFAIMSHEGWHQYTQVTFQSALPTWLEEGIATYMEGRSHSPGRPVRFMPWSNRQRLDALQIAWERGRLIPMTELVDRSPQHFLKDDSRGLLTYYAQVWAMVHFLMHGEDGKYRQGLRRVLGDAAEGRLAATILSSPHIAGAQQRRQLAVSNYGPGVLITYFNRDWAGEFQEEFSAFVERVFTDEAFLKGLMRDDMVRLGYLGAELPGGEAQTSPKPASQQAEDSR